MSQKIWAFELLKRAEQAGYSFAVRCEGETAYKGPSAHKAWEAVKAFDAYADVTFLHPSAPDEAARLGCPPGFAEDETIIDYTIPRGSAGFINSVFDDLFGEEG